MCRSELKGMLKELTSEGPGSDRPRGVVREKGRKGRGPGEEILRFEVKRDGGHEVGNKAVSLSVD
jgi:hypothetical protein